MSLGNDVNKSFTVMLLLAGCCCGKRRKPAAAAAADATDVSLSKRASLLS